MDIISLRFQVVYYRHMESAKIRMMTLKINSSERLLRVLLRVNKCCGRSWLSDKYSYVIHEKLRIQIVSPRPVILRLNKHIPQSI
jgi:hypothetical protein